MTIDRNILDGTLILKDTETGETVSIRESVEDGYGCIKPEGRLTGAVAHDLEDELTSIAIGCKNVVMDMRDVSHVDNSIIQMMLEVQHMVDSMDGEFILQGIKEPIMTQFVDMNLDAVFEIEGSETTL